MGSSIHRSMESTALWALHGTPPGDALGVEVYHPASHRTETDEIKLPCWAVVVGDSE
jgi:hypothetical protein